MKEKKQMSKPSVKAVQDWYCQSYEEDVQVYSGRAVFDDDYFKVVVKGKVKYFYGEQAWSDAERFASDAKFKFARMS
jgi:hypothetical protein